VGAEGNEGGCGEGGAEVSEFVCVFGGMREWKVGSETGVEDAMD
jgi:hypothetical protein